jgi:RNA polymerase sigma-70 factor (ECF subfamily)
MRTAGVGFAPVPRNTSTTDEPPRRSMPAFAALDCLHAARPAGRGGATAVAEGRRGPSAPAGTPPPLARDRDAASDAELMAWTAAGDRLAFDALTARHAERVLRVALRILGDRGEAEEVAQEALLRAWQHAAVFDPRRARLTTWLHRITVNLALDRARRRAAAPARAVLDEARDVAADPAEGPEQRLAAAQERARLAEAMAALPPRQRAAIALAYEQELPGAEAAAALAVSPRALEGLLRRARHFLLAWLRRGEDAP